MRLFAMFLLFLVWCCSPLTVLAQEDVKTEEEGPLVLAILEFDAVNEEARKSNKGRMVSEIFTTAAVQSGLQVVERHMIRKVMDEMEFGEAQFSGTTAQKIGQVLGANAVMSGSVSEFMGALRIDARLINVADGAILLADGGQAELNLPSITSVVQNLMGKMLRALGQEKGQDADTQNVAQTPPAEQLLVPVRVEASSSLPPSKSYDYGPGNLLDGNHATVWVEGAKDAGRGQWVTLVFQGKPMVSRISFVNGYNRHDAKSGGDRWLQNGRVKKLRLSFSNGQHRDIVLEDKRTRQEVTFAPVRTKWIKMTILENYPGVKWPNDTCLAEVSVYGSQ